MVVRGGREGHDPIDQEAATMAQFAQTADRLHPPKHFLDQFAFLLTDRVARMVGGAPVNCAMFLLRDVPA